MEDFIKALNLCKGSSSWEWRGADAMCSIGDSPPSGNNLYIWKYVYVFSDPKTKILVCSTPRQAKQTT